MIHFESFGIHLLSAIFLLGLLGSTVVVVISFVEDFGELFTADEQKAAAPHIPPR